jgi:hypothetical protein
VIRRWLVPLPFALLCALPIGVAYAWSARAELVKHEGPMATVRAFWVAVAFGFLVHAPAAAYFVAFHGDWAYLYLTAWSGVPSAVDLSLVVLAGALVPLGFLAAAPFCATHRTPVVLGLFAVPLGVAGALALGTQSRLASSATFAQFHGGFGVESITQTSLGPSVLLALGVLVVSIFWSVQLIRVDRKPRG